MSTPARPAPRAPRASRRVLLLSSAGTVLSVVACDAGGEPERPGAAGAPTSSDGPSEGASEDQSADGTGAARDEGADVALVSRVHGDLAATATLVTAARRSAPALRADLSPLLRLHRRHARVLGDPLDRVPTARQPAPRGPLLGLVRDREEALQESLVEASLAADSGGLARLLASMAAGLGQQLAVLRPGGDGTGTAAEQAGGR